MKKRTQNVSKKIGGVITALVSPFYKEKLDTESFSKLVKAQLKDGINGFVINGTTGESPTLEKDEVKELFQIAKKNTANEIALIVGTGSNNTAKTIQATKFASELGADAALVVTPYYNKPPQRGLIAHFTAVADASDIPIILYDVPGRTITALEVATVAELSRHKNIIGIKDATGNMQNLKQQRETCAKDFIFLSGDDATCVEYAALGGHGVISVISHLLGKPLVQLMKAAIEKSASAAAEWQKYAKLTSGIYVEANPIPVKAALKEIGLIRSAELRLPLVELAAQYLPALREELKRHNLVGVKS